MNTAIVNIYARSIQRGARSLEQVPEELREEVTRLYDEWMSSKEEVQRDAMG